MREILFRGKSLDNGKWVEGSLLIDTYLTVLEPSAGKGDLIDAFSAFFQSNRRDYEIDCIESDRELQYILKGRGERLVHDDFLTFSTRKRYDLIIMNPPFSNGDKHLLKALDMQTNGGQIVCLLNAETLRNPYTNSRYVLAQKLQKLNAKIKYVKEGFTHAQRKTDVEVAIVYVNIPAPEDGESEIYEKLKKARGINFSTEEARAIASANPIENLIQTYNLEIDAALEFFRQYNALTPYISAEADGTVPMIRLSINVHGYGNGTEYKYMGKEAVNEYIRRVRAKYWSRLFRIDALTNKFTSNIREKYDERVASLSAYDFTEFNIRTVLEEMDKELNSGVEESIMNLFEKLSAEHSWFPECKQNIHYYNGWKTNKAHKVGMKAIIPSYGCFAGYISKTELRSWECVNLLADIEKALDYLNWNKECKLEKWDLVKIMDNAQYSGQTRKIYCTYFTVDFFKKGTCHIKFHPEAQVLIDRLNIFASQHKGWLPPNYGRVHYEDMEADERDVIDGFQGKEKYEEIMVDTGRYLRPTGQNLLTTGANIG